MVLVLPLPLPTFGPRHPCVLEGAAYDHKKEDYPFWGILELLSLPVRVGLTKSIHCSLSLPADG